MITREPVLVSRRRLIVRVHRLLPGATLGEVVREFVGLADYHRWATRADALLPFETYDLRSYEDRSHQTGWRYQGGGPFPNVADGETFPVRVFREDPAWERVARWWQLRACDLERLHVAHYECAGIEDVYQVQEQHPGCVLVY